MPLKNLKKNVFSSVYQSINYLYIKGKKMKLTKIIGLFFVVLALGACQQKTDTAMDQSNTVNQKTIPKIGLQLWSINDEVKADFKGTLTQVAAMGFEGVEFAGAFGPYADDGVALKAFLDNLGLVGSAAHVRFANFDDENFAKSVKFYRDAGVSTLIVPWDARSEDAEKINDLVADLNALSKKLIAEGFQFGYHNHDEEFAPYKDTTFWDHIARSTTEEFVLQMDVGWVVFAEHDPVEYIQRYPGRTKTTHFKAKLPKSNTLTGKRPIIGDDITDWVGVINADIAVGGTEWIIVEQEEYPDGLTPLEAVKLSKDGLEKIIANNIL